MENVKNEFKEYFTVNSEEEAIEKEKELIAMGYNGFDVCYGRYCGKDGLVHRAVFVWA